MKLTPLYGIITMSLLLFIAALLVGYQKFALEKSHVLGIVSPLSEERSKLLDQKEIADTKKTLDNSLTTFFPKNIEPKFSDFTDTNAKAYAVMERNSGELLLAKNITQELPIASVTKIMTALVALEHADLRVELTVPEQAAQVGEATMGLTAGEIVTVEELLYGIMLPSGNDAAETLASGLQGSRNNFLFMMNQKAQSLGMFDTFYINPSGLDGDTLTDTSFSTALDQLVLANYALHNEIFASIAASHYKEFPYIEGKHKALYLYNILQLDRSYPGIKGIKPGITEFAQETLVSYAENGGKQILIVLLGTENSRDEVIKIYDYIFPKLGVSVH